MSREFVGNRSGVSNVTPAQAGVQLLKILDSRFRGNDKTRLLCHLVNGHVCRPAASQRVSNIPLKAEKTCLPAGRQG